MIVPARLASAIPPGFVALDEGKLLCHRDFVPALLEKGWTTSAQILDANDVDVFRKLPDRENVRVTFDGPKGKWLAYMKRHQAPTEPTEMGPGISEAQASLWCEEAGVGVAPVIAFGRDDRGREFFLSQDLVGFEPADDWLKRVEREGATLERINALFRALGRTIGLLHTASLFHRDLYWCHLFVRETAAGQFDVRLIDLQRIHRPRWRLWRWRLKDLGQFAFAFPTGWGSDGDLRTWFAAYLDKDQLGGLDIPLLRAVQMRARLYSWRENYRRRAG
jgi:heptose I phosphotransferase